MTQKRFDDYEIIDINGLKEFINENRNLEKEKIKIIDLTKKYLKNRKKLESKNVYEDL